MKKFRGMLLIIIGIVLVAAALLRAAGEYVQAVNATLPPPAEEVLETFAPDTGPLRAATRTPTTLPAATLAAPERPTQHTDSAQPAPTGESTVVAELPEYTGQGSQNAPNLDGPYLGERIDAQSTPTARPTAQEPAIPDRIIIPAIQLDAPVVLAASQKVRVKKEVFYQWVSPEKFAAGWHTNSAYLGEVGNTVINGHHNMFGKVFGKLVDLNPGDAVEVRSHERSFHYRIVNKMILPERDAPIEERLENARWILSSEDERLTLITCWPAESNTHRLILVAVPDPAYPPSTSP